MSGPSDQIQKARLLPGALGRAPGCETAPPGSWKSSGVQGRSPGLLEELRGARLLRTVLLQNYE